MKEYRIVKETATYTNAVEYYIEVKVKFLIWDWWEVCYYYPTYEEAKVKVGRLTQEIIREVVE